MWSAEINLTPIPDALVARALARFGSVAVADPGWFTVDRLRDRVAIAAAGWDPSSSTLVDFGKFAPVIEQVWARRDAILDQLDALPHVLSHGDALPRNLLRHDGPDVVAIDWGQLGYAPIGADLASFSMWAGTDPAKLLDAYTDELRDRSLNGDARTGLLLSTALIAVSRAIRTIGTPNAAAYQTRLRRALPLLVETTTIPT